jgi:hypothetical protein
MVKCHSVFVFYNIFTKQWIILLLNYKISLVHRHTIQAVGNIFLQAFSSTACAGGQYKWANSTDGCLWTACGNEFSQAVNFWKNRPCAEPPLPLHHTLTCVLIPFWFPTYYTNPCVICLFDVLNDFKSKSCQLQSFITFRDEQLSYWSFLHPRSFTKFECKIWDHSNVVFVDKMVSN